MRLQNKKENFLSGIEDKVVITGANSGVGWSDGTNLDYLKSLVAYWQHEYDWRKQEATLNRYTQFRTDLDGLSFHFIHEWGKGPNPLPIILTHSWHDSFYRMHKIIPMLTDPESFGGNAARRVITSSVGAATHDGLDNCHREAVAYFPIAFPRNN